MRFNAPMGFLRVRPLAESTKNRLLGRFLPNRAVRVPAARKTRLAASAIRLATVPMWNFSPAKPATSWSHMSQCPCQGRNFGARQIDHVRDSAGRRMPSPHAGIFAVGPNGESGQFGADLQAIFGHSESLAQCEPPNARLPPKIIPVLTASKIIVLSPLFSLALCPKRVYLIACTHVITNQHTERPPCDPTPSPSLSTCKTLNASCDSSAMPTSATSTHSFALSKPTCETRLPNVRRCRWHRGARGTAETH